MIPDKASFRGTTCRTGALLLLLLAWLPTQAAVAVEQIQDIRVLIDISGSMKKSDPGNLRAPALRMLTGLLPTGSLAGVWTFGKWTNMLVPHGRVDAKWKDLARRESDQINSVALFTDIGQVVEAASRSWKGEAGDQRRVMVLLTDGRVDISKDEAKNVAARTHLLGPLLKRLKEKQVRLYPIGLSDGVDRELLERLAKETGGLFQTARSADDLYRIFLRILEGSGKANTLPIREGGFLVDASVRELNIVVFRAQPEQRIALRDPKGSELARGKLPGNVRWHEEAGYAVVTIPDPQAGRWRIVTAAHPDNRVFVVSDLRLEAGGLPETLVAGEEVNLQLGINDGDKPLTDGRLLAVIAGQVAVEHENGGEAVFPLQLLSREGEIRAPQLGGRVVLPFEEGLASLLFTAEGPTFHRSVRRIVRLKPPLLRAHWQGPSHTGVAGTVELEASAEGIDGTPVTVTVLWEGPGVTRLGFETRVPAGGRQSLLYAPQHEGRHTAQVVGAAVGLNGRQLIMHLPPLAIDVVPKPVEKPKPAPRILIPAPEPPRLPGPVDTVAPKGGKGVESRWLLVAGIANLILILAAAIYYRQTSRRETKQMDQRIAALERDFGA
ncbi:MAG: hypothetical protein Kow006_22900 [Gammaproteobacteria bacterium]